MNRKEPPETGGSGIQKDIARVCQVPCGVAVSGQTDDGRIYVADYNNRRLVRLTRNARYDGCFVAAGTSSTQLVQPQALDFAADGRLVVVDRTHVKIFDVGIRPPPADAPHLSGTSEMPATPQPASVDDGAVVTSGAKPPPIKAKPTKTGPKPAVPPRPKFLKEMTFADQSSQAQGAQTKTVSGTTSSASVTSTTATTSPSSTVSRTTARSTSVTPQTPTNSYVETEVW